MKILELRFKNLNSLYGEWRINFTDAEYIASSIFALTGPTGAGKSTILDAISLALYGATPRLGKISASGNEIMSRHTGECYAEICFESQTGRFYCRWSQHRAHKKMNGKLAEARHEIYYADSKKVIETKKLKVADLIEKETGMDFDRFTRSMLLAQGSFDSFLKAEVEQKSRILEEITGTEIYSEISKKVHERLRTEKDTLDFLQNEISTIDIPEQEEEEKIHTELKTGQKENKKLSAAIAKEGEIIQWLDNMLALQKERNRLANDLEKLESEINNFQPQNMLLARAQRASELDGSYATLTALRKEQKKDETDLKAEKRGLPELELFMKQEEQALLLTEKKKHQIQKDLEQMRPLIRDIHTRDRLLAGQRESIDNEKTACAEDGELIRKEQENRDKKQKEYDEVNNDLQQILRYLTLHASDRGLLGALSGIEEQLTYLSTKQEEIIEKGKKQQDSADELNKVSEKLRNCTEKVEEQKKILEKHKRAHEQEREGLNVLLNGRRLEEYKSEKDALMREMLFFNKIIELEEQRSKLEDGKECPLCGAKEHPYAKGNIPRADKTEKKIHSLESLISKAEKQNITIQEFKTTEEKSQSNLAEKEKLEIAAHNEKEMAKEKHRAQCKEFSQVRSDITKLKDTVLNTLRPFGIENLSDLPAHILLSSLKERLKIWEEQEKKKTSLEVQLNKLSSILERQEVLIETHRAALSDRQTNLAETEEKYERGKLERQNLFGNKNPDEEEKLLRKTVDKAEEEEKNVRARYNNIKEKFNNAQERIRLLTEKIENRAAALNSSEIDFQKKLETVKFSDENEFLASRLDIMERNRMEALAKELNNKYVALQTRKKDKEKQLDIEIAKNLSKNTVEDRLRLTESLKEHERQQTQIQQEISRLANTLENHEKTKESYKAKKSEIEIQQKEYARWEKLHKLIGSADGKKYRNFAQGLTFEVMISHANSELEKLSDRYLLVRDVEQQLELNVFDNYQAGELRSTRNLSGGESFIVSLSLALGLSKMASRKVKVDSLFLDEGFGTLDEDSLETALEALSGLQRDGKLIGIISHVTALKERISTQINVTPISGGKSVLHGPGCSKVE